MVKVDFELDSLKKGMAQYEAEADKVKKETEEMSQRSSISLEKMTGQLQKVMEVGVSVFDKMAQASPALGAQLELANFYFMEMFRELGDALAPLIENVVIPLIKQLTEWFSNLPDGVIEAIAIFAGLAMTLSKIIPIIQAISSVGVGMLGWIGLIIAAIIILKKAWDENWGGIRDFFLQIWEQIKQAWETLKPHVIALWEALKELWKAVEPILKKIFEIFKVFMGEKIKRIIEDVKLYLGWLVKHLKLVSA